jgi:hypothetical protein
MRRRIFLTVLSLFFLARAMTFAQGLDIPDVGPGLAPAEADPRVGPTTANVLTLEEAVRVALEKNPTVQAADAYAQAVEEGIAEAKARQVTFEHALTGEYFRHGLRY